MRKLVSILSFLVLWPSSAVQAQLYALNGAGVTFGAVHTVVRDLEATKQFWALFGGKPVRFGGIDAIGLPGVFIFLHQGEPSGPSRGAVVDHLGVSSPIPYELVKRLVAAGVRTDPINPVTLRDPSWKRGNPQQTWMHVYSPDGLRVEIETNPCAFSQPAGQTVGPCPESIATVVHNGDPTAPIGMSQMHFYLKDNAEVRAFYDFYEKHFGGRINQRAGVLVVPGAKLNAETSPEGQRPSNQGRALDSIGFEVKNLEEFCNKLGAAGVRFSEPYSKTRYGGLAHAAFTDAWGVRVQLTEGLTPVCYSEGGYLGLMVCSGAAKSF